MSYNDRWKCFANLLDIVDLIDFAKTILVEVILKLLYVMLGQNLLPLYAPYMLKIASFQSWNINFIRYAVYLPIKFVNLFVQVLWLIINVTVILTILNWPGVYKAKMISSALSFLQVVKTDTEMQDTMYLTTIKGVLSCNYKDSMLLNLK